MYLCSILRKKSFVVTPRDNAPPTFKNNIKLTNKFNILFVSYNIIAIGVRVLKFKICTSPSSLSPISVTVNTQINIIMVEEVSQLKHAIDLLAQQISDVKISLSNLQTLQSTQPTQPPAESQRMLHTENPMSIQLLNTQMSWVLCKTHTF